MNNVTFNEFIIDSVGDEILVAQATQLIIDSPQKVDGEAIDFTFSLDEIEISYSADGYNTSISNRVDHGQVSICIALNSSDITIKVFGRKKNFSNDPSNPLLLDTIAGFIHKGLANAREIYKSRNEHNSFTVGWTAWDLI